MSIETRQLISAAIHAAVGLGPFEEFELSACGVVTLCGNRRGPLSQI